MYGSLTVASANWPLRMSRVAAAGAEEAGRGVQTEHDAEMEAVATSVFDKYVALCGFESGRVAVWWTVVGGLAASFPFWGMALKLPGARATFHVEDQPFGPQMPSSLLLHLVGCIPVCFMGIAQFVPSIRNHCLWLHRWNGRLYAFFHTVSGAGVLWMMYHYAQQGDGTTFWAVLCLFIGTQASLLIAVYMVCIGNIQQHRQWMLRNYSWNTSVITIRFLLVPFLKGGAFATVNRLVAWGCDAVSHNWDPQVPATLFNSSSTLLDLCEESGLIYVSANPPLMAGIGLNPSTATLAFGSLIWVSWLLHATVIEVWIHFRYLTLEPGSVTQAAKTEDGEYGSSVQAEMVPLEKEAAIDTPVASRLEPREEKAATPRTWLQRGVDPLFSDPRHLSEGVSNRGRCLFVLHVCMGLGGLICTQHFNRRHDSSKDGNYFGALFASGASTSFTLDVLILAASLLVFMGFDSYKLGFSMISYTILVLFSFIIAISYTGPLYLAFRMVILEKNDAFSYSGDGEVGGSLPQPQHGFWVWVPWIVIIWSGALAFCAA